MTVQRLFLFSLMSICFAYVHSPYHSCAMDPRFELDPAQVQKDSGTSVRREKSKRGSFASRSARTRQAGNTRHKKRHNLTTSILQLSASTTSSDATSVIQKVRSFWDALVPAGTTMLQPLTFKSENFDLTIDPARYPQLKTADGGIILLDSDASLPPLVQTLIQEKDPKIRIVSGLPTDARSFLGKLLMSGGFYSVEEQPAMAFGKDPLLRVRSDFKVERSAESVMRSEVLLVSASRQGVPSRLADYLKKQGFTLVEPFAEHSLTPVPVRHRVVRAASQGKIQTVDLVLETLSVAVERSRRVELFKTAETGVGLSVAAERYFEHGGKRFVVTHFTGDPITYTLFRLLETKGYRVVILEPKDNFRAVTTKLLSRMDLPASYTSHLLLAGPAGQYSFEMSGFMLENAASGGGAVMLTDRPIEGAMRDLLYDHGYQVQER